MESIHSSFRFDLKKEGGGPLRRIGPFKVQPLLPALHKKRPGRVFRGRGHIARETVSRVLFLTVIYLDGPSPGRSSHPGSGRASLGARSPCSHTGVAPDRVYSDGHFHEPSGELLPRLSTLTPPTQASARRYLSVALFLKLPSAGVTRYPCPVEPGLSSWTGFRPAPATIQRTRRINSTQTAAESQRKFTERGGLAAFYPVPFPPPTGSPRESAPRRCGTALPHPTESLPVPDGA